MEIICLLTLIIVKIKKFSYLGNWLEKQSSIFKKEADNEKYSNKPNFRKGQIIKVDFGINMGSELFNIYFAIVLNSDDNTNVGNILNDFKNDNKYSDEGYALITQITTISKKKIIDT